MERRLVLKYLRKAVKDGKSLKITTSKEKVMQVNVIGYEKELVKYTINLLHEVFHQLANQKENKLEEQQK